MELARLRHAGGQPDLITALLMMRRTDQTPPGHYDRTQDGWERQITIIG
jgi:hypothetical protein